MEPIRELAKDKVPFNWSQEHQSAFTQMKQEVVSAPILAYYNPKKQTDASIKGLGTCLLQEGKPVYFASKALIDAQWGYVAIELELFVVALAMEKFHHFLYSSHFILETDQKPLKVILSKSINKTTPRLQRILRRTFPYHSTVWYIPGLTNKLADCLSILGSKEDTIKLPKLYVYQITNQLCVRGNSLQQIRIATQEEDELVLLKQTITQGWPSTIKEVPSVLQSYRTFGEEQMIGDEMESSWKAPELLYLPRNMKLFWSLSMKGI